MGRIRRVITKSFGRIQRWGEASQRTGTVYISDKCKGLKHLEISLHEGLHIAAPYLGEHEVIAVSKDLALMLWDMQYRRPDNDTSQPLQEWLEEEE